MDLQDSPQKDEQFPVTHPYPRCPECAGDHVEPFKLALGARPAWYCIDCCFSWFR